MTKEDFIAWKNEPVTVAWFNAIKERIAESQEVLGISAGLDPNQDNFMRGMIRAFDETLNTTFEGEDNGS